MARKTWRRLFAFSSAARVSAARPTAAASFAFVGLPRRQPEAFLTGPLRDQPPILLRERCLEVQHERIGIAAQLGDDEGYSLRH